MNFRYLYKKHGSTIIGVACAGVALVGSASPLMAVGGFAYGYIGTKYVVPVLKPYMKKGFDTVYNYLTKDVEPVAPSPKLTTVSKRNHEILSDLSWDKQAKEIQHKFKMPNVAQLTAELEHSYAVTVSCPHVNLKLEKSKDASRDFSRVKESGNPFSGGLTKMK